LIEANIQPGKATEKHDKAPIVIRIELMPGDTILLQMETNQRREFARMRRHKALIANPVTGNTRIGTA